MRNRVHRIPEVGGFAAPPCRAGPGPLPATLPACPVHGPSPYGRRASIGPPASSRPTWCPGHARAPAPSPYGRRGLHGHTTGAGIVPAPDLVPRACPERPAPSPSRPPDLPYRACPGVPSPYGRPDLRACRLPVPSPWLRGRSGVGVARGRRGGDRQHLRGGRGRCGIGFRSHNFAWLGTRPVREREPRPRRAVRRVARPVRRRVRRGGRRGRRCDTGGRIARGLSVRFGVGDVAAGAARAAQAGPHQTEPGDPRDVSLHRCDPFRSGEGGAFRLVWIHSRPDWRGVPSRSA